MLEAVELAPAVDAADVAEELDPELDAALEALAEEAAEDPLLALLAALALDADAAEVTLAPELAAETDATVLEDSITNCGV